jgi:hypothetical protein
MSPRKRPQKDVAASTREATTTPRAGSARRQGPALTGYPLVLTMIMIMAGPRMTMNMEGKMQPTSESV